MTIQKPNLFVVYELYCVNLVTRPSLIYELHCDSTENGPFFNIGPAM